ncbi:hypothetical protein R1flu_007069 [Riccia fluitans]|uniref:Uncharacterized protein n=1 Tax=Riccia fluitans TaxID=41844 RepID=A0ABD1YYM8_9MARC
MIGREPQKRESLRARRGLDLESFGTEYKNAKIDSQFLGCRLALGSTVVGCPPSIPRSVSRARLGGSNATPSTKMLNYYVLSLLLRLDDRKRFTADPHRFFA